ncbi:4-hydroxy-tetrahydrodipicolinate reductase [Blochmannia endosymbiont of Camponotus nipponensis]|uniref:4-hydroxy-tetrahydrodipicolinate reductase n=1 Tax=Blochmannia endosymbiont of Camponotus nipponensis TaxID=2681986 RepID=UPI001357F7FA|nr:4-hydroxy-tetrahydrodipicolinate reductase [Blochmannia endosymbiont of Camponotus nipponensis]
MNSACLRVAVSGVTGRMGEKVLTCIVQGEKQFSKKIVLGAAIARSNSNICGMDVGTLIKTNALGVKITDNIESIKDDFDILIDFTAPDISMEYLKFCTNNKKNIIIGTTGFNLTHKSFIKNASQKIGIVFSSNFSVSIALILKILCNITQSIGSSSDINIVEAHHNKKHDIPSGTSLMMKDVICNALRLIQSDKIVDCNVDCTENESVYLDKKIMIHSLRAGDIVGEHTVLFTGLGECLEITHKVSDRLIFAHGALRAAVWLGCDKIGLFSVSDILE